jgi:hypothetical protein
LRRDATAGSLWFTGAPRSSAASACARREPIRSPRSSRAVPAIVPTSWAAVKRRRAWNRREPSGAAGACTGQRLRLGARRLTERSLPSLRRPEDVTGTVVVAAWMFERVFCTSLTLGTRRASLASLRESRAIVDAIRTTCPTRSSGTMCAEVCSGKSPSRRPTRRSSWRSQRNVDGDHPQPTLGAIVVDRDPSIGQEELEA